MRWVRQREVRKSMWDGRRHQSLPIEMCRREGTLDKSNVAETDMSQPLRE